VNDVDTKSNNFMTGSPLTHALFFLFGACSFTSADLELIVNSSDPSIIPSVQRVNATAYKIHKFSGQFSDYVLKGLDWEVQSEVFDSLLKHKLPGYLSKTVFEEYKDTASDTFRN
jgi:hypothetical protein